jgi:adenosylmethionine-8-amino-7-oxononanoate aminotransferase
VNIHGHSHPKLNAALAAQARELEHVVFAGCTHRPAVELAERLLEILPRGLARVFYSDNGSTAVEVALKMAIQYWQNCGGPERRTFIALNNAYHGDTVGAMSASADSVFTRAFEPLLFPIERVGNLEELEKSLGASVAAVIIEPMLQGAGGMIVWPAEFVAGVRKLCDHHGVLMIADEVLTGFGRTGKMFACEHAGITPDIVCLSKALTGLRCGTGELGSFSR